MIDGKFDVDADYAIKTKTPGKGKIFLHNGSRHIRGVADPNLSLLAWRSAKIINTMTGKELYDVKGDKSAINWRQAPLNVKKNKPLWTESP